MKARHTHHVLRLTNLITGRVAYVGMIGHPDAPANVRRVWKKARKQPARAHWIISRRKKRRDTYTDVLRIEALGHSDGHLNLFTIGRALAVVNMDISFKRASELRIEVAGRGKP